MFNNIQLSTPNHLNKIALCHKVCFQNSFAAKIGLAYIQKTLEWFLTDNNKFLFFIEKDNMVVGYCGGFLSKGVGEGSSSSMLQYAFKEAVVGVIKKPWLLLHKDIIKLYPLIFRNIKNKIFKKKQQTILQPHKEKLVGLVVIGVHPNYRGTGIFDDLMQYFFKKAKELSNEGAKLSVKKNNDRAIKAYQKYGWQIKEELKDTLVLVKYF